MKNFVSNQLAFDIGSEDTEITLDDASKFDDFGYVVIDARDPDKRDVVYYGGKDGNTLTNCVRNTGGTIACNHKKGALIQDNVVYEYFHAKYILTGYSPVNYNIDGDKLYDHLAGIDSRLQNVYKSKVDATQPPTQNNDSGEGYSIGSLWIDTTHDEAYRCLDNQLGNAVWINTTLSVDELGTLALQNTIDHTDLTSDIIIGLASKQVFEDGDYLMISDSLEEGALKKILKSDISIGWNQITSIPLSFTPSSHYHDTSDIQTGTLSLSKGGLGNTLFTDQELLMFNQNTSKIVSSGKTVSSFEPVFTKNSAFNKNFGTTAGSVSEGNHSHSGTYEPVISVGTSAQFLRGDKTWQNLTTDAVTEGTKLFYTNERFDTRLASKTTDDLTEGNNNQYYTEQRVSAVVSSMIQKYEDELNKVPSITQSSVTPVGGLKNGNLVGSGSATSDAWVGNEYYGWYLHSNITSGSAAYIPNGGIKLTITTTGGDGRFFFIDNTPNLYSALNSNSNKFLPLEIGAKYKFTVEYDVVGNSGGSLSATCEEQAGDGTSISHTITISGNTTKISQSVEFTAGKKYGKITVGYAGGTAPTDGTIINVYKIFLERIVEISTPNLGIYTQSVNGIKGSADLTRIGQEYTTVTGRHGFGDGTNYRVAQSFIATKKYLSGITFNKGPNQGTPTAGIRFQIQTNSGSAPSGTRVGNYKISNTVWNSISDNSDYFVELPCHLIVGNTYRIVFEPDGQNASNYHTVNIDSGGGFTGGTMSVYNGSVWSANTNDIYFKTHYVRKTCNIKLSQHNKSIEYTSTGILKNAIIDFKNGKYIYKSGLLLYNTYYQNILDFAENVYQSTDGGETYSLDQISVINRWGNNAVDTTGLVSTGDSTERYLVMKINTVLPIKNIKIETIFGNKTSYALQISLNNSTRTDLLYATTVMTTTQVVDTSFANEQTTFYLRFHKDTSVSGNLMIRYLNISADLEIGSMQKLYNYETGTDLFWTIPKILQNSASKVYLRMTKYGYPALEYQDSSSNVLDYQFLPVDITGATSSSIDTYIKISESTSFTQLGDGDYLSLGIATATPILNIKAKIQYNRLLCAFGDTNNDLDNESSEKAVVYHQTETKGIKYSIQSLQDQISTLSSQINSLLS